MNINLWPSWFYGPNDKSEVFESADQVPEGWQDHPSKVEQKAVAKPAPTPPVTPPATTPVTPPAGGSTADEGTIDAEGWPFDASIHAATRSITKGGLWRMKVGATRPDPKPGFPKPVLDL